MLNTIRNCLTRRRLRNIVVALPFALERQFGNTEFYTTAQAGIVIAALRIKPALMSYALVVALAENDAAKLDPQLTPERCAAIRNEIADAFDLPDIDFTAKDLRKVRAIRQMFKGTDLTEDKQGALGGGVPYSSGSIHTPPSD